MYELNYKINKFLISHLLCLNIYCVLGIYTYIIFNVAYLNKGTKIYIIQLKDRCKQIILVTKTRIYKSFFVTKNKK